MLTKSWQTDVQHRPITRLLCNRKVHYGVLWYCMRGENWYSEINTISSISWTAQDKMSAYYTGCYYNAVSGHVTHGSRYYSPGFNPRPAHLEFVVDKLAPGDTFLRFLPSPSSVPSACAQESFISSHRRHITSAYLNNTNQNCQRVFTKTVSSLTSIRPVVGDGYRRRKWRIYNSSHNTQMATTRVHPQFPLPDGSTAHSQPRFCKLHFNSAHLTT